MTDLEVLVGAESMDDEQLDYFIRTFDARRADAAALEASARADLVINERQGAIARLVRIRRAQRTGMADS